MSGLSTYLSTEMLEWFKGLTMPAAPAAVYVALYNGDPGDAGAGGSDVTATVRPAGRVAAVFGSITSKAMTNSSDVDYGNAAAGASVTHFAIWDAGSAGNCLATGSLQVPRTITTGDQVRFLAGDLSVSFA